jgi:hypothetical protein
MPPWRGRFFPMAPFAAIAATFPEKESLNGRRRFAK